MEGTATSIAIGTGLMADNLSGGGGGGNPPTFIEQEDGFYLLQENGFKLIITP